MRRPVTVSPALLLREFNEEFNRSGKIVPAGIAFWANNGNGRSKRDANKIGFIGVTLQ
jgi:hypothetical protein